VASNSPQDAVGTVVAAIGGPGQRLIVYQTGNRNGAASGARRSSRGERIWSNIEDAPVARAKDDSSSGRLASAATLFLLAGLMAERSALYNVIERAIRRRASRLVHDFARSRTARVRSRGRPDFRVDRPLQAPRPLRLSCRRRGRLTVS